jgi:hypothetical protein
MTQAHLGHHDLPKLQVFDIERRFAGQQVVIPHTAEPLVEFGAGNGYGEGIIAVVPD